MVATPTRKWWEWCPDGGNSGKLATEAQSNKLFDSKGKEVELPGLCDIDDLEMVKYLEMILKAKVIPLLPQGHCHHRVSSHPCLHSPTAP